MRTAYDRPECELRPLAAQKIICFSGTATGENFAPVTDFGGIEMWEATK